MRTLVLPAPLTTGDHRVAEDEAHHAISVLRVSPGDALRVVVGGQIAHDHCAAQPAA